MKYRYPLVVWEMYEPWDKTARLAFVHPTGPHAPHLNDSSVQMKRGDSFFRIKGVTYYVKDDRVVFLEVVRGYRASLQELRFSLADVLESTLARAICKLMQEDQWVIWRPLPALRRSVPLLRADASRLDFEPPPSPRNFLIPNPKYL